jgi:hypothetical protein
MMMVVIIIIIIMGNTVLYLAQNFWTTLGSGFTGFRFTEGPPVYELCSNNASRFVFRHAGELFIMQSMGQHFFV